MSDNKMPKKTLHYALSKPPLIGLAILLALIAILLLAVPG